MNNISEVEKFVRDYIADEWKLYYECMVGDLDDASFEVLKNNFFEKYFVDAEKIFEFSSHEEKFVRSAGARERRKSKMNLWRDSSMELFLIKKYQLQNGQDLFRAYVSDHFMPRPEIKSTGRKYNESLFISNINNELKIVAKYKVDGDFALVTARDPQRMKFLKEKNYILQDAYLTWIWSGGDIITSEMIQTVTDGLKLIQPSQEKGYAGDYQRPISNNKLGELDLDTIDLAAEVISELKFGSRTDRHSGLPNYDWVLRAYEVASDRNKEIISQAVIKALVDSDTQLRMEALALLGAKPKILHSADYLQLLQNNFDLFNNQRHPFDSKDRNRGSDFVVLVANHTEGKDKKDALELIRKLVKDPVYMMSCISELFFRDRAWFEANFDAIRAIAPDLAVFDAKMESLRKV